MGDVRVVTGIFYYRANGMPLFFHAALMDRDVNVVTGQQPDAHPGRFFAIQYQSQSAFGSCSRCGTGGKSCA
jgi:hypothetical protein